MTLVVWGTKIGLLKFAHLIVDNPLFQFPTPHFSSLPPPFSVLPPPTFQFYPPFHPPQFSLPPPFSLTPQFSVPPPPILAPLLPPPRANRHCMMTLYHLFILNLYRFFILTSASNGFCKSMGSPGVKENFK